MGAGVLAQEHRRRLVRELVPVEERGQLVARPRPEGGHGAAERRHARVDVEAEVHDLARGEVHQRRRADERARRPADPQGARGEVPARARQRREAGELLDGQAAAAVERPLHLVAVVARRPQAGEIGGDHAGPAADEPLGAVHPEPRPVPEVVRAREVAVVTGPQDGGLVRLEVLPRPLELRGADGLAARDAAQVEEARRPDHAVERQPLDGETLRIEAERAVEVGPHVVGGQEDAPLARLRVLVEGSRGRVGQPDPELRTEVVDRHALVDRHAQVDHARDGPHGGPMRRHAR